MDVRQDIIAYGKGVRTGYKLRKCLGLVIHWIGVAQGHAEVIRKNFARSELGTQYISDWYDGHIIQCAPEDEVCYHVGSSYGYTAKKKELVGDDNPNWYFVGIECCIDPNTVITSDYGTAGRHMDLGKPSQAQYNNLVEFSADFLTRHHMTVDNLYRHYDITGKVCHAWFVKDESRWVKFKADVEKKMKGEDESLTKEDWDKISDLVKREVNDAKPKVYHNIEEVPLWARDMVNRAIEHGAIKGDENGNLRLTDENLVTLQIFSNCKAF